ncbi:MAG: response regulator transcription factor [Verrucomicrobiota bacterium]
MPTIAVVEDDPAIRRGVSDALRFAGYDVLDASNLKRGLAIVRQAHFQLLLLDLILPGGSGFDILEEVGINRPGLPVIILSACGEEADRVRGLELGADDYVVKPFSMKELLARVEAVLRRSPERQPAEREVSLPGAVVDLGRHELRFESGARTRLSERESSLIAYLASQRGRVVSRAEILRRVWGIESSEVETRTIDMHVANLRSKFREQGQPGALVETVRGKGYRLADP